VYHLPLKIRGLFNDTVSTVKQCPRKCKDDLERTVGEDSEDGRGLFDGITQAHGLTHETVLIFR
jgi:hypothetical protein